MKAVAGNLESGKEVIILLFEQRGEEVVITEEVVKAAAGNENIREVVLVILLAQRGAEVDITETVVKTAAMCSNVRILKVFESHFKVFPSMDDWSIANFYNAAKSGDTDTILRLLTQGIEPDLKNIRCISPLWVAAARGHLKVVQVLLNTTLVDVNSRSLSGKSPLFRPAASGYLEIVKLLLEEGADRNVADENGDTPCSIGRKNGHYKIAKLLAGE